MISLKNVKTVFKKEFLQVMRDKSVLMTNFFLPLFGLPLYFIFAYEAAMVTVNNDTKSLQDDTVFKISYQGELRDELGKYLAEDKKIEISTDDNGFLEEDIKEFQQKVGLYEEKNLNFSKLEDMLSKDKEKRKALREELENSRKDYLESRENLTKKFTKNNDLHIAIFKDSENRYNTYFFFSAGNKLSKNAKIYVYKKIREYEKKVVDSYIQDKEIDKNKLHPIITTEVDFDRSTGKTAKTMGVGMGAGIMFILLIAIFNPAINTTIGERDNKTFKVLLMNPISLHEIFIGKYLSVAFQGLLALIPYSLEAIVFYSWGSSNFIFLESPQFGLFDFFIIFLGTISVSALISAICFLTSSFAKTRNQAQSLMSFMMIAMIIPMMMIGIMDLKLNTGSAFLPLMNFPLITEFLAMKGTNYINIAIALFVNLATSLMIIWFSIDAFSIQWKGKADVQTVSDLLSRKRRKASKLNPGHAFIAFALSFLGMTYGSLVISLLKIDILNFLFTPILFILGSAVFIMYYSGMDFTRTLKWNNIKESYSLNAIAAAVMLSLMFNLLMTNSAIKDMAGIEVPQLFESNIFMASLSYFLLFAFLPAVTEEILFRGVIFKGFRGQYNFLTSMIISSVLFAILHFSMFRWGHTFAIGLVLAYLYEKKGLMTCILYHMTFNATSIAINIADQQLKFMDSIPESMGFILAPFFVAGTYFILKLKSDQVADSQEPPSEMAA